MIRTRDPFQQALEALRLGLTLGRFVAGRPIVIADEARGLGLSTTPVREALCWLGGEGLVERGGAGGFFAPRLEPALIARQYAMRRLCLLQTEGPPIAPPPEGLIAGGTAADRLLATWRWRVRALGDASLHAVFEAVQGRLVRFAAAEARLFPDVEAEAEALLALPAGASAAAIETYHERRILAAPMLALSAESDSAPEAGT